MKDDKAVTATVERAEDGREFAEMLKTLSDTEKAQVKGVMIGMVLARQTRPVPAPDKAVMQLA